MSLPGTLPIALVILLIWVGVVASCQGAITVTFDGGPHGGFTQAGANPFIDASGMQVGSVFGQSISLTGGGVPGYADNGTSYLDIPVGQMRIGFNRFPQGAAVPFSLLSFDAAEHGGAGAQTLTLVGYIYPQAMGQSLTVTNVFNINSLTFQTFQLSASFASVYQADVLSTSWSLDNLVFSVPEPSITALASVGILCVASRFRAGAALASA